MREQLLKTWPGQFESVFNGTKTFEVRFDDREFQIGDVLVLLEYNPQGGNYTGRSCRRVVTHILDGGQFGIERGFVVMSIARAMCTCDLPKGVHADFHGHDCPARAVAHA